MSDRYALVPVKDSEQDALDRVLDAFGRSSVTLAECLDTDSMALSANDMQYFDKKYYGRVPTYAVFMRYLNKIPAAIRDSFLSTVAEVESSRTAKSMAELANADSIGLEEVRRFNMLKSLNNRAEKQIDRFDRRAASRADTEVRTADMAARLISALSNADLLRIKGRVDAIDAEYQAIEVADSEPPKEGE